MNYVEYQKYRWQWKMEFDIDGVEVKYVPDVDDKVLPEDIFPSGQVFTLMAESKCSDFPTGVYTIEVMTEKQYKLEKEGKTEDQVKCAIHLYRESGSRSRMDTYKFENHKKLLELDDVKPLYKVKRKRAKRTTLFHPADIHDMLSRGIIKLGSDESYTPKKPKVVIPDFHKDVLGQEMRAGDRIVYAGGSRSSHWLSEGVISELTQHCVKVDGGSKAPDKCCKVLSQADLFRARAQGQT